VSSISVNVVAACSFMTTIFGLKRQGSRLEVMTGKKQNSKRITFRVLSYGSILSILSYFVFVRLVEYQMSLVPLKFASHEKNILVLFLTSQLSITIMVFTIILSRLSVWEWIQELKPKKLPPFPVLKNGIVLGSTGEELNG
jgi:uncharacterized membrane protein (DUF485 family)